MVRPCSENGRKKITQNSIEVAVETKESTKKTEEKLDGRCKVKAECPLSLDNGRLPYGHINQRLQVQFIAPDDERCAARNMLSL